MDRFRTTITLNDNAHLVRRRTVRTEEAVVTVQESIKEDPNELTRRSTELKPNDHRLRRIFGEWAEA